MSNEQNAGSADAATDAAPKKNATKDNGPRVELVETGVDVIVVRGSIVVGYDSPAVMGVNERGQECIVAMGNPISVGPGGRVTLDHDEAVRLLERGVVRMPMVDADLPSPSGMHQPKVGFTEGVQISGG